MDKKENTAEYKELHFRKLEREWQNEIGQHLLDGPHEVIGSSQVFAVQFQRIIDQINLNRPGPVLEIGCGKGHFLAQLASAAGEQVKDVNVIGIDISHAVKALPQKGLIGICADGQALPFADSSLNAVIYDGALHHLIDYQAALREAFRTLAPGGRLILFEPVSSLFSRTVHHVLDPLIFRQVEYESPIDQEYKDHFREEEVVATIKQLGMQYSIRRTDFLAYPLTGCYAGSVFNRWPRFMQAMLAIEKLIERIPGLRQLGEFFSWRFLLVAEKPL
jgi:ubiquinone/menaquinone biosynthesis C-methylase UbiE